MTDPSAQLPLGIRLHDDATFDNFYRAADDANAAAVAALQNLADGDSLWLWGASGSGVTHLLQAACHAASARGQSSQYLPLVDMLGFAPAPLFEGLEQIDWLCLDGLQQLAGQAHWEQALFHLFNRARESGARLLFGADAPPAGLPWQLPDLQSRLSWGAVYQLQLLDDGGKLAALQQRAGRRGLSLSDEVGRFILSRASRDMNDLFAVLNRLDDASLAAQRKLTIPFVKQVLKL